MGWERTGGGADGAGEAATAGTRGISSTETSGMGGLSTVATETTDGDVTARSFADRGRVAEPAANGRNAPRHAATAMSHIAGELREA